MKKQKMKVRLSPALVIREEFDNYAILYVPDTSQGYAINPVSVFVCRMLDGSRTVAQIVAGIRETFGQVPDTVEQDVEAFVDALVRCKLAKAAGRLPAHIKTTE